MAGGTEEDTMAWQVLVALKVLKIIVTGVVSFQVVIVPSRQLALGDL